MEDPALSPDLKQLFLILNTVLLKIKMLLINLIIYLHYLYLTGSIDIKIPMSIIKLNKC